MTPTIDASVYQNAERLHRAYRPGLVPGGWVRPAWIDGGRRFWYARHGGSEKEIVLVDPAAGTREVVTVDGRGLILKVNPVVLGAGAPLFDGPVGPRPVTPTGHKAYPNGFALMRYRWSR